MKSRKSLWLGVWLVLGLVMIIGCSDDDDPVVVPPTDDTVNETIGSTGGSIEIASEISLTIPGDALDGDVDFTLADAEDNYTDMVATRLFASSVFSIGPSGTTFNDPVQLVLHYNEGDLGAEAESSIVIYTDDGTGWTALATTVDEAGNTASADVTHLSDFAVTVPAEGEPGEILEGTFTSTPGLSIPDALQMESGTPVNDYMSVMATGTIDSVRVYLNITHNYASDLILKLTSPDGTELKVFWICEGGEPNVDPAGWYPDDFTPKEDLNGFDGENVGGTWKITAQDMSYQEAGVLNEWRLHLFYVE